MCVELAFTAEHRILHKHSKLYGNEVGDQLNLQISLELLFGFLMKTVVLLHGYCYRW